MSFESTVLAERLADKELDTYFFSELDNALEPEERLQNRFAVARTKFKVKKNSQLPKSVIQEIIDAHDTEELVKKFRAEEEAAKARERKKAAKRKKAEAQERKKAAKARKRDDTSVDFTQLPELKALEELVNASPDYDIDDAVNIAYLQGELPRPSPELSREKSPEFIFFGTNDKSEPEDEIDQDRIDQALASVYGFGEGGVEEYTGIEQKKR